MKKLFADKAFYSRLIKLTLPIAFQSLLLASVAAAAAVMLGRVEQDSMSAVSLATQIQFVQNMILGTVTAGGAILGAQYWGKKDKETVEKIFGLMIRLTGLASFLFFAACIGMPELLMKIFAHEPDLISIGVSYLRIAGWSYLLTGISQCYLTMMKITEHAGRCALISSGAVLLNVILNAVFIFGLFGVPAMGARGAAIATLISRIVELVWAIIASGRKNYVHLHFRHLLIRYPLLSADFTKIALPILGGSLFWGIGFTSYTAIMGHLGGDAAAANAIAAVVRDLFCCLCNGIASAGGIIVGMELGRGNLEQGRIYGNRIAVMSFIIGFLCTGLVLLVTPAVVNYIKLTDQARHYLVGMMVVMSIYMIGRCVNTIVINGIFSAGGDTLFDVYSLAVCMWGIAIPTAVIGAFFLHWPVVIVYACTCLDEVGKIPWVMYHYRKYKWVKDLTRESVE